MHLTRNYFFTLLFLLYPLLSFALPEDKLAKVFVVADSTIYNYKSGVNVFIGNVKVDQGTTHITADKLVTKANKEHKIQEAIAYGIKEPAHYWTLQKVGDPEIHAHAMIIKFYPIVSNVTLEQKVTITQGENSFQGELILYNMQEQTITVPPSQNNRAVLVYNPDR